MRVMIVHVISARMTTACDVCELIYTMGLVMRTYLSYARKTTFQQEHMYGV
jgi:hypothetical protein